LKNRKDISYKGWLNEDKMSDVLTKVVKELKGELLLCGYKLGQKKYKEGTQIKLPGSKSHYDFGFTYNDIKYLVEFDGNYQGVGHYNNAENCYKDDCKNELAIINGYEIIRFPYWLQLNNSTFEILFGFDCGCNIVNDFPNGFITNSSLNPASFCKLGLERFLKEINKLSDELKFEVFVSLKVKSDRLNVPIKYIWDDNRILEIQSHPTYKDTYNRIKEFADKWNTKENYKWE
jgi:hypothetical protein